MAQEAHNDLLGFVERVAGDGLLRVEETLGNGFVRLRVSEAERRQAKHDIRWVEDAAVELLRNARDAEARTIYLATAREGSQRTVVCIDDGLGVPVSMRDRIFEARVTSKLDTMAMDKWGVHGRGMALFSIRHNATEACVRASEPGGGSAFVTRFDCDALPERADQSSWPQVGIDEGGQLAVVRGPHNIVRAAVDFALDCRDRVDVFFGSPSDILATLVQHGRERLDCWDHAVAPTLQTVPVWMRPALATNASELIAYASGLGIVVSERTAYRIFSGDIAAVPSLVETVVRHARAKNPHAEIDLLKDRRGLKVTKTDLDDFSQSLERAFRTLGDRYYLCLKSEPRVRVARDSITVTFDIEKEL